MLLWKLCVGIELGISNKITTKYSLRKSSSKWRSPRQALGNPMLNIRRRYPRGIRQVVFLINDIPSSFLCWIIWSFYGVAVAKAWLVLLVAKTNYYILRIVNNIRSLIVQSSQWLASPLVTIAWQENDHIYLSRASRRAILFLFVLLWWLAH